MRAEYREQHHKQQGTDTEKTLGQKFRQGEQPAHGYTTWLDQGKRLWRRQGLEIGQHLRAEETNGFHNLLMRDGMELHQTEDQVHASRIIGLETVNTMLGITHNDHAVVMQIVEGDAARVKPLKAL